MNNKIIPVLLCGGEGKRLGLIPPKQFQNLLGECSMIEETARRCMGNAFTSPLLITHQDYKDKITNTDIQTLDVLYETKRQNTGPAIAMCVDYATQKHPDNPLLFLPCDHFISDTISFQNMILSADPTKLTCFGKRPTHPETNYGYIETDGKTNIKKFHEKPDLNGAKQYIENTNMFWNMGIFYALPKVFQSAFQKHAPDIFNQTISFDKAVMEHIKNAVMIEYDGAWQDIGLSQHLDGIPSPHRELIVDSTHNTAISQ